VTFPLCILSVFLDNGNLKSSLLSLAILLSYIVLMTRLDKTKLGGYAKVIGKIAKESIKPFIVICILLCGFLIAFRNRSIHRYNSLRFDIENNLASLPNQTLGVSFAPMDYFKDSFEFTIFKIYYMMAGDHQTDNMGIDDLTLSNSMNFVLYLLFLFIMSTLAFNIFTGL
jgi:hypothetical protein